MEAGRSAYNCRFQCDLNCPKFMTDQVLQRGTSLFTNIHRALFITTQYCRSTESYIPRSTLILIQSSQLLADHSCSCNRPDQTIASHSNPSHPLLVHVKSLKGCCSTYHISQSSKAQAHHHLSSHHARLSFTCPTRWAPICHGVLYALKEETLALITMFIGKSSTLAAARLTWQSKV